MKKNWHSLLIVGMVFGTAWAVSGQFGHIGGSAWAGGIGGMALVVVSGRKDWYSNFFTIALASAVGWGFLGILYDLSMEEVKYVESVNFLDNLYRLQIFIFYGVIYGLLGGGLVGLTLFSSEKTKIRWGKLFLRMLIGGVLCFYILIYKNDMILMPPMEAYYAFFAGAGLALSFNLYAYENTVSIDRVLMYSSFGTGFGFILGKFLQTLGFTLGSQYHMWNLMEYCIGFFGGIGMAYGVFSSDWPEKSSLPKKGKYLFSFLFLFVLIPLYNNFNLKIYLFTDQPWGQNEMVQAIFAGIVVCSIAAIGIYKYYTAKFSFKKNDVLILLITYLSSYIIFSQINSGISFDSFLENHLFFWINVIIISKLIHKNLPAFRDDPILKLEVGKIILILGILIFLTVVFALFSSFILSAVYKTP